MPRHNEYDQYLSFNEIINGAFVLVQESQSTPMFVSGMGHVDPDLLGEDSIVGVTMRFWLTGNRIATVNYAEAMFGEVECERVDPQSCADAPIRNHRPSHANNAARRDMGHSRNLWRRVPVCPSQPPAQRDGLRASIRIPIPGPIPVRLRWSGHGNSVRVGLFNRTFMLLLTPPESLVPPVCRRSAQNDHRRVF